MGFWLSKIVNTIFKLDLVVGVLVGSPTRLLAQSLFLCNLLRSVFKLMKLGRLE